ncbi:Uridine kinase [Mesoplasma florum W37]|uniref:Uridine kinase n=1 Tax=Mesoplasma florum TaxID=2151 RepID=A0AAD2JE94_MESFO|nr:uridine kinase [Mesoplasma florum]AGY41394.1 Uridine kinase [Mesoplasma florum W37]AVN59614.1 uridine kinase [Mesoplasma florum]AVN65734.1 Uridine kinase [Mesoplasma florum]
MSKKVTLILIAGGTASGKTTVADRIANEILKGKSVTHISMDNYYKDFAELTFEERRKINFDHPNSVDSELLLKDLQALKEYQPIKVPVYDFKTSSRTKKTITVKPSDVVILDGIFALAIKEIRKLGDIKIFIKTANDLRFIRRLQRDVNERGRTLESVINQYLNEVKPMHDAFIGPSIEYADLIIPYKEGNDVAVDLVATKILSLLN